MLEDLEVLHQSTQISKAIWDNQIRARKAAKLMWKWDKYSIISAGLSSSEPFYTLSMKSIRNICGCFNLSSFPKFLSAFVRWWRKSEYRVCIHLEGPCKERANCHGDKWIRAISFVWWTIHTFNWIWDFQVSTYVKNRLLAYILFMQFSMRRE